MKINIVTDKLIFSRKIDVKTEMKMTKLSGLYWALGRSSGNRQVVDACIAKKKTFRKSFKIINCLIQLTIALNHFILGAIKRLVYFSSVRYKLVCLHFCNCDG